MQTEKNNLNRRPSVGINVAGATFAILLILLGGWGYRTYDAHLNGTGGLAPLARGSLATIPLRLSGWEGTDAPLKESIFQAADCDDALQRNYQMRGDPKLICLYIAVGVRARDLVPHRPDVCYPSNGFTQKSRELVSIPLGEGKTIEANLYRFDPSHLSPNNMLVLNFYSIGGTTAPDVETLRKSARGGQGSAGHVAQVQITRGFRGEIPDESDIEVMREFAAAAAPEIEAAIAKAAAAGGVR